MELQRLHCQCGVDLVDTAKLTFEDMGKVVSLARNVEIKCAALSDDHVHGQSLVRLGSALTEVRQPQEALVHLNRALKAAKNNPCLAAGAYQTISDVHYRDRRLPEALDATQEAWKLVESSPNPQANISLDSALIHFSANRDTEAWEL
jgi:tetratricopeptide (TPR) repeat protein